MKIYFRNWSNPRPLINPMTSVYYGIRYKRTVCLCIYNKIARVVKDEKVFIVVRACTSHVMLL